MDEPDRRPAVVAGNLDGEQATGTTARTATDQYARVYCIKKCDDAIGCHDAWLDDLRLRQESAPLIVQGREELLRVRGALDALPPAHDGLLGSQHREQFDLVREITMSNLSLSSPLNPGSTSTLSSVTSGASGMMLAVCSNATVAPEPELLQWGTEQTRQFIAFAERRDKAAETADLLRQLAPTLGDEFVEARNSFERFRADVEAATSVGTKVRNVHDGAKGELINRASSGGVRKSVQWQLIATLAKPGYPGAAQLIERAGTDWTTLQSELSDLLKEVRPFSWQQVEALFHRFVGFWHGVLILIDL